MYSLLPMPSMGADCGVVHWQGDSGVVRWQEDHAVEVVMLVLVGHT